MNCNNTYCKNHRDECYDMQRNSEVKDFSILLEKIQDVKDFVIESEKLSSKIAIISHNNYVCDAKSLMGIFGLDLSQPVTITTTDENDYNALFNFCKTRGIVT